MKLSIALFLCLLTFGWSETPTTPGVLVWTVSSERLEISKWAFVEILKDPPEVVSIRLFKLDKKVGHIPKLPRSLPAIIKDFQAKPFPRFLGPSVSYALFDEADKRWYIVRLENDTGEFLIHEANIAFEDTLAFGMKSGGGANKALSEALRKLKESPAPNAEDRGK